MTWGSICFNDFFQLSYEISPALADLFAQDHSRQDWAYVAFAVSTVSNQGQQR